MLMIAGEGPAASRGVTTVAAMPEADEAAARIEAAMKLNKGGATT